LISPQPNNRLDALEVYDPKYLPARHYLNANESPYAMPSNIKTALANKFAELDVNRYPAPLADDLRQALALHLALGEQQVLVGNGGDELLLNLAIAYGGAGRKVLICPPTFSVYATNALLTDTELLEVPRCADMTIDKPAVLKAIASYKPDLIILTSPNNPSGDCIDEAFVHEMLEASDGLLLLDQAYIEFAGAQYDMCKLIGKYRNLAILRTFSKAYGLAGLRLGYVLADAEVINNLIKVRQPYSVDAFSALCGAEVVRNAQLFDERLAAAIFGRKALSAALGGVNGFKVYPSEANFLLVDVSARIDAGELWRRLYKDYGVLVRDMSTTPRLAGCLRISVGAPEDNAVLMAAIYEILEQ
jgi:histidinol-phosphate aminotransferase